MNSGLLCPKVRNNIGGDIPVDVPPTKILGGDVSPASPAALTPVTYQRARHIVFAAEPIASTILSSIVPSIA